jgi:hypothetical protein
MEMHSTDNYSRNRPGWPLTLPLLIACALLASAPAILVGQSPVYQSKEEKLPKEVAAQPVEFSHKKHTAAGITCLDCHASAMTKERAGLPDAEACLLCHGTIKNDSPAIQGLAKIHQGNESLKWVRIYQVPDFVFFNHSSHLKAGEKCATCHGPVETRDTLAKEVSTSMTACMNCHVARKASTECFLCHQLGN